MMLAKNMMTGTLIAVIGICLLIFMLVQVLPKTKTDHDGHVLTLIYSVVALGIVAMGGWIFMA